MEALVYTFLLIGTLMVIFFAVFFGIGLILMAMSMIHFDGNAPVSSRKSVSCRPASRQTGAQ